MFARKGFPDTVLESIKYPTVESLLVKNQRSIYMVALEIINRQRNAGYWMLFLYDENSLSTVDLPARGAG